MTIKIASDNYLPYEALEDDKNLLNLILKDSSKCSSEYMPSNFWRFHQDQSIEDLINGSIFKLCSEESIPWLVSMGAVDERPKIDTSRFYKLQNINEFNQGNSASSFITDLMHRYPDWAINFYNTSLNDLRETAFRIAKLYGESKKAQPIEKINIENIGYPQDRFKIGNCHYTYNSLIKYMNYSYCNNYFNFNRNCTLVELGAGIGKQIYIIKTLHPKVSFLNFDLPIQLYCCEQYLKKLFRSDLISYRETREWKKIPKLSPGKVYMLGSWQFPLLTSYKFDLFWNSASFQEMEPEIVENYLNIIRNSTDYIYLNQNMSGMPTGEKGTLRVLNATTEKTYFESLNSYKLINRSEAFYPLSRAKGISGTYEHMFFEKIYR
ncbi:MAG: hypothetical protein CFH01_00130 [Alphaproteobacteria bacterium MarineAlpha2_Bin1]|nr:MAG: hypothetical protein CFH01_00130 [Alphaproteobacteria bacterium MarineAlpha2_Bin1]|tara:strand:- start:1035 stop:2171 length:1137 start_codon:yes stop_codon:yes gene_type:complete